MSRNRYRFTGSRASGFSSGLLLVVLLFLTALGGFAWVGMGIVANDRWPIRWLELNGNFQRVSAEQIRAGLSPLIHSSFFTMDLQDLREAAHRHAWVSRVNVRKRWPDTVVVQIEEYQPLAHWNRGRLISVGGTAFEVPEADGIQGLPWLHGPEDQLDQVLETWARFSESLSPLGLEIQQLKLDRRGSWSMLLTNGTRVQLGRDSADQRLHRLLSSWEALLSHQSLPPSDVDLRYTNGFAVNWPQPDEELAGNDS